MLLSQFTAISASSSCSLSALYIAQDYFDFAKFAVSTQRELPIKMFISATSNCESHIPYQEMQNILTLNKLLRYPNFTTQNVPFEGKKSVKLVK